MINDATLYHGDCRDILPSLDHVDAVITDPVWPNALPTLTGAEDPHGLFASTAVFLPKLTDRLAVQLGCDSDPRFLSAIPREMPFFRACWLEYAAPHYKGRILYTGDVAYLYGVPPKSKKGAHVIPGKKVSVARYGTEVTKDQHPCARRREHVEWLVHWFSERSVIDPFMGSGTTGVACADLGREFIGIEIEREFFDVACERITAAYDQQRLFA
ncbi:MAG: DNA methyltransferase [Gammaproteobacteria bacterium]